MPLIDRQQLKGKTGRKSEGNLFDVCEALSKYKLASGPRVEELYIVYKEVKEWLKADAKAILATKNSHLETAVMIDLRDSVIDELNLVQAGLGDALMSYDGMTKVTAPTTSLAKGYKLERKTYMKGDKAAAPYSASRIQAITAELPTRQTWAQNTTPQALAQNPVPKMYFLNKVQRLRKRVTCTGAPPNVRWVDFNGQQVSTRHGSANVSMGQSRVHQPYVMDRYGNIFVDYEDSDYGVLFLNSNNGNAEADAIAARGKFNHSSLLAGREVICAGLIYFWKGQLIHIDNNSGHYQPNHTALHRAVEVLRDLGAELNYLRVGYKYKQGGNFQFEMYKANTFLTNGAPDWPSQNVFSDKMDHTQYYRMLPPFQE